MFVESDKDSFETGLMIGDTLPAIRGSFQGNEYKTFDSFSGENGFVLVVNRSLEWCPYCMRQSIDLQKHKAAFDAAGLSIVMMTYDAPEIQSEFVGRHGIEYTVLSDIEAQSFENLGVIRGDIDKQADNYGLPYPGMIIVDKHGMVKGKLFIEAYSKRVDTEAVLSFARESLGL
jgi:peroxiredoxin